MKKKVLLLTLALTLVLAMLVALAACGVTDIIKGGDEETETEDMKSADQVKTLIGNKYLITIKVRGSSTDSDGSSSGTAYYTTASDGTYYYWAGEDDNTTLMKKVTNGYLVYTKADSDKYNRVNLYASNETDPFLAVNNIFFTENMTYNTKSSTTYLDRACTKYTFKEKVNIVVASYSMSQEWIVDDATGACLSYSWTTEGQSMGDAAAAEASFECTQFETGNLVDNFILTKTSMITVTEWNTGFFHDAGLTGTIAKPDGEFKYGQLSSYEYDVNYTVTGSQADATKVNALLSAFYTAGAKYDYDGNMAASYSDELICEIENGTAMNSINFTAYTSDSPSDRNSVGVQAYCYGDNWTVMITVMKHHDD